MNEQTRLALDRLKQQQTRLERELGAMAEELQRLEQRVLREESADAPQPSPFSVPSPALPQERLQPPPIPRPPVIRSLESAPPIPPIPAVRTAPANAGPAPAAADTMASPPGSRSIELRLGSQWAPRIGIVMLLTGLVMVGSYAFARVGAWGKIGLLYSASAVLLGAGAWWQRKASQPSLKNYAQVLFAGGLAAVYFTTYGAYHVDSLRVIGNAWADGALLLGWAGYMVWIADRRKSEVLALFAVGLAYYSSVITRVGSFTLYSNLLLTAAAVFFLMRNRWATLSFASVVATYASYAFWRFYDGSQWHWASPGEGLWHGVIFLGSYWILFTAAVFLSRHERLAGVNRATFLTLNNTEFFALFLLTMLQVREGGFWKVSLGFGMVLLALTEVTRRLLPGEPPARNAYLTQGLLLVTIGIIARFAGLNLALLLGAESVVLLTMGYARDNRILRAAAWTCAMLSVGWGVDSLGLYETKGLLVGASLGFLMVFNAFWSRRQGTGDSKQVRPGPAYFTVLALVIWFFTTWDNTSRATLPLALGMEAILLTFSIYLLGVGELALFGQAFLVLGQALCLIRYVEPVQPAPWWHAGLMIAVTLLLSHWWQKQKVLGAVPELTRLWQVIYALALVGVLGFWLEPRMGAPGWLGASACLALVLSAYGLVTQAWFLIAAAQIFTVVSVAQFALQLWQAKPDWYLPLAPIVLLAALSGSAVSWLRTHAQPQDQNNVQLREVALVYRWVAMVMSIGWVGAYIPARDRIWVLATLGLAAFVVAVLRRNKEAGLISAAYTLTGMILFWFPIQGTSIVFWPNLAAMCAILAQQRTARRMADRAIADPRWHYAMIFAGGAGIWLFVTCWVADDPRGLVQWLNGAGNASYLTASWAALALVLFGCGIAVRERGYRWLGLAILGCAMGRVFIVDVWKLETLYRILSFMALGVVLLVLGFVYNKYQEKLREWL